MINYYGTFMGGTTKPRNLVRRLNDYLFTDGQGIKTGQTSDLVRLLT